MELAQVTPVILFMVSVLLAMNAFFLKGLIRKIESSEHFSAVHGAKFEALSESLHSNNKLFTSMSNHLANIDKDVAVLKYAIQGYAERKHPS